MKRRLVSVFTILAWAICVGVAACWISSYRIQFNIVWTNGRTHNQLVSYKGALYHVQSENWWRKEALAIHIDSEPGTADIANWPGVRVDKQHEAFGITKITGQWMAPPIQVPPNTEFNSAGSSIKPGTMYYSRTPMTIRGVEYWLFLVVPGSWLVGRLLGKMRGGTSPEAPPSSVSHG
ncbi:MAG: hypothetical protein KY476_10730 [Planctomycetes bacterium]|nr:hypothetical protein [Planctomycetota bacterium]